MTTKEDQITLQEAELVALRAELETLKVQKPVATVAMGPVMQWINLNDHGRASLSRGAKHDLYARPVPAAAAPSEAYQQGYNAAVKQCRKQIKNHRDEIDVLETALKASRAAEVPAVDARDSECLDFMIEQQCWVQWTTRDGSITQCQVFTQDEDENYHVLSGDDQFFNTPREALIAAIAASQVAGGNA